MNRWLQKSCRLTGCAVIWAAFAVVGAEATAARPNVLIIMSDDQGYGDLSCHGNPVLKTPALDRLHAESIRLVDFHVAPMCTPTRGQLMTGLDALHNGATSVTAGRACLRPGLTTMPELFARAGYRTGIFGKWHLGDSYPHRPMDRGFQEAQYIKGWGFTSAPEFTNTLFDGRYFHNGSERKFSGYITDFSFSGAQAWMQGCQERGEPFLCYLPLNAPHGPWIVDEKYSQPYARQFQGKPLPAKFFGMIANLDENMDRLDAFLRRTGLYDNTIVIFMTDNGGTGGVRTFNAGMRAGKTTYYDGGHRVPCFIRWPAGKLRPAGDVTGLTENQDVLPTVLDLCEVARPADLKLDGVSLAGVLRDPNQQPPDRTLVVQYGQILKKWDSAVMWRRWRLVHGEELYDLANDPAQQTNVATAQTDVYQQLRRHYEAWWNALEKDIADYVPLSLGAQQENPVELTSSDWQDIYSDNWGHVKQAVGGPRGGQWNVLVEHAGDYQFELRRWPPELHRALAAGLEPDGKALPIAAAALSLAGVESSARIAPDADVAVLRVKLPAGRAKLSAWFQDANGNDLCGAFYARVQKLD